MKTTKITSKLSIEERETQLNYDPIDEVWVMCSTIPKHFRKALKQEWQPKEQYVYEDGTVCAMILTAPERAITIRNINKKEMSEKQLKNLPSDD